jgi:hypothetical protein
VPTACGWGGCSGLIYLSFALQSCSHAHTLAKLTATLPGPPPPRILYSTNVFLKYHVCQQYRGDVHYVWCSEQFDSRVVGAYNPGALLPPSSNPADIYRDLKAAVAATDTHNAKIAEQRVSLIARATAWEAAGEITAVHRDEIIYFAQQVDFRYWRPLLYVIPCTAAILPRLQNVPAPNRAGLGAEYIIQDLQRNEFDLLEL